MYNFFLGGPKVKLKTIASGNSHYGKMRGTKEAETMLANKKGHLLFNKVTGGAFFV